MVKIGAVKRQWAGGGGQRPVWRVKEPYKRGASSAAKTHCYSKRITYNASSKEAFVCPKKKLLQICDQM